MGRLILILVFAGWLSGCAVAHHVQVGDVDNRAGVSSWEPFEVVLDQAGFGTAEIHEIAKAAGPESGNGLSDGALVAMIFQMGPRTGNQVYDLQYAEGLRHEIYKKCPSGRVTNLMSIRESKVFPIYSREIVKVKGLCGPSTLTRGTVSLEPSASSFMVSASGVFVGGFSRLEMGVL